MEIKDIYMHRCLRLAENGRLSAPPNPMVGAVIVYKDSIIGEGYHAKCGQAHAEVNAIASVRPEDRPHLQDSTLYVSLEPCAHYGRTPPCARLILNTGIPRVVVGCEDPFDKVEGRGITMLRDGGVQVTVGVLEQECRELNRHFFTFHTKHRPYITLKWASSADGFVDNWREDEAAAPVKLSNAHSLMDIHRLRAYHQAILVGHGTLKADRPQLNVRDWVGSNPQRLVLGHVGEDELPAGFTAYADVATLLQSLTEQGIQSLLVEGGPQTQRAFIERGLWDEAIEELSPLTLGSGVPAPRLPVGIPRKVTTHWGHTLTTWRNS